MCRQLGYGSPSVVKARAQYHHDNGSRHIWMSGVSCKGDESHLHDCPFDGWGVTACRDSENVGIVCEGYSASISQLNIRKNVK